MIVYIPNKHTCYLIFEVIASIFFEVFFFYKKIATPTPHPLIIHLKNYIKDILILIKYLKVDISYQRSFYKKN